MIRAPYLPIHIRLALRWLANSVVALVLALGLGRAATSASAAVDVPMSARSLPITAGAARPRRTYTPAVKLATMLGDTLLGASGKLRARILPAGEWRQLLDAIGQGEGGGERGGIYALPDGIDGHPFALIARRDFSAKVGAYLGSYRMGYWPAELHRVRSAAYQNPAGFVEVTRSNADTRVSEHFRLRDFLTHDQVEAWPRYLVLREDLLDKLELVLDDLARSGHPTTRVIVLSGFRTPAHNMALGDASGRARESRHQFGDAADIIIDADGDGRMDDLDMDGRSDVGDVRVVERAVERVERAHPELVGGLGLYQAMGPSGPFAHIDVRGEAARWMRARSNPATSSSPGRAAPVAGCQATGTSAVLCSRIRRHPRR